MKRLITLSLVLILAAGLFAQNNLQMLKKRAEHMKSQKIAFITNKLNLTPEEAQAFWPVYNEYEKRKVETIKQNREDLMTMNESKELSENEYEQMADDMIQSRLDHAKLMKEYHEKFKKILPASKLLKLYRAEEMFNRELIEKIQDRIDPIRKPFRK